MNALIRRALKSAALVSAGVAIISVASYFGTLPDFMPWYELLVENALIPLVSSTFIAAGLLTLVTSGWSRLVALVAFIPATAAIALILLFSVVPAFEGEMIGVAGFVLVELAPPVEAFLVVTASVALVIHDVRGLAGSRRQRLRPS